MIEGMNTCDEDVKLLWTKVIYNSWCVPTEQIIPHGAG